MIIRFVKAYLGVLSALVLTLFLCFYDFQIHSINYATHIQHFNQDFKQVEKKLDDALRYVSDDLKVKGLDEKWVELNPNEAIDIHIYRNDSLKFWSSNQLPIIRFAEIHFPSEGVVHLQNGWYYSKIREIDDYKVCATFLIKHDFAIENQDLINDFNPELHLPFKAKITIGEEDGEKVYSSKNEYIFSIIPDEIQPISETHSFISTILLLAVIISWILVLIKYQKQLPTAFKWVIPVGFVLLRLAELKWGWLEFMSEHPAFNPTLYGSNFLFPTFFDYLLNLVVFVFLLQQLGGLFSLSRKSQLMKMVGLGFFVLSFFIWGGIMYLAKGLVENSTISMAVDKLFELSTYSVLALASLGILFFFYFQFLLKLVRFTIEQGVKWSQLAVTTFIIGCVYFYIEINYGFQMLYPAIFPLLFYGVVIYIASKAKQSFKLATGLILLLMFSASMSSTFNKLNETKERSNRGLYANQLATEKNIQTEVEYYTISESIAEDKFLKRFIANPIDMSVSDFQENLERRFFNGYWERYELNFSFFNEEHISLIDKQKINTEDYDELEGMIKSSCTPSELNPSILYVNNYYNQFSYVIRQEIIGEDGKKGVLFCTLKSKKIPEEIGFPRLLISSNANVLESLEQYSIARYRKGVLLTNYGEFNFPSSLAILPITKADADGLIQYGDYNHLVLKKSDNNVVVLSKKNQSKVEIFTAFSYMFCFFGALLLPMLFRSNRTRNQKRTISLAMKIQIVLISLVFISLLAFGWGSGVFVSNQYNEFTNDVIREKLNSVEKEVKAKLGEFDRLTIDENGDYMQFILQKFARVFFTDINLYDANGYLLGTSRPKVFNVGLISDQMNPVAFKNMKYGLRSEFIQQESIGKLNYSSAYQPFYNSDGKRLAFINLQHFGQQTEFENQIEKFLVAIVNVFVLLLAISIILAILVSNWLTSPLRRLQENFAHVKFGTRNEHIAYDKHDEIGALVKEYNQKLDELEFTAGQLAKSERESAWREMAKQVAHEIKNPLTPMKLSVQQLLRSFDPNDEKSKDKLERVANSIIEQIDALTKIANEFSTFAKMPNPSEEKLDLVHLIKGVIEVFDHDDDVSIHFDTQLESLGINCDKDQIIRVFNNLIKNAIQSITDSRKGEIILRMEKENKSVLITISDNGSGIKESEHSKIFVPYFTTKGTGTGLGLAMVKQIIENHQGKIDFDSEVDKGTTFYIRLPLDR